MARLLARAAAAAALRLLPLLFLLLLLLLLALLLLLLLLVLLLPLLLTRAAAAAPVVLDTASLRRGVDAPGWLHRQTRKLHSSHPPRRLMQTTCMAGMPEDSTVPPSSACTAVCPSTAQQQVQLGSPPAAPCSSCPSSACAGSSPHPRSCTRAAEAQQLAESQPGQGASRRTSTSAWRHAATACCPKSPSQPTVRK